MEPLTRVEKSVTMQEELCSPHAVFVQVNQGYILRHAQKAKRAKAIARKRQKSPYEHAKPSYKYVIEQQEEQ